MSGVFSRRGSQPPPPPKPAPAPAEADPSMEDILASIRRILNEGEGDAAAAETPAADAPVAAAQEPASPETAVTEPTSAAGDAPVNETDVLILDPAMMVTDTATTTEAEPSLASTETVAVASQSLGALKKALSERHAQVYKGAAISLEEIVREEVRPMLKDWLDAHLPSIVERLVRTEIERVVARELT